MRLITAREVSKALGVALPRVYELARLRVIPSVRRGPKQIQFDQAIAAFEEAYLMSTQQLKEFFDRAEYYVFRSLLLALLLIAAYRILENEIHLGRFVSELMRVVIEYLRG